MCNETFPLAKMERVLALLTSMCLLDEVGLRNNTVKGGM